jgi:hypothetical protein
MKFATAAVLLFSPLAALALPVGLGSRDGVENPRALAPTPLEEHKGNIWAGSVDHFSSTPDAAPQAGTVIKKSAELEGVDPDLPSGGPPATVSASDSTSPSKVSPEIPPARSVVLDVV